jgi:hypothetical protein
MNREKMKEILREESGIEESTLLEDVIDSAVELALESDVTPTYEYLVNELVPIIRELCLTSRTRQKRI